MDGMVNDVLPQALRSRHGAVFVIAEAGVNHDGDVDKAVALVDAATDAHADAVKFQTFSADRLVTRAAPKAAYQKQTTSANESQHAMLKRLELSDDAHRRLAQHAASRGIAFWSTPFDEVAADFLDALGVPVFKVPSGELTNLPFLRHVAKKRKPMVISTGMATLAEVERALGVVRDVDAALDVVVLHCTSNYPAAPETANLRAMDTLARAFGVVVGYSDHTLGLAVPTAAVALGARVLEKHFTLDKRAPGPDHAASLDVAELKALVAAVRAVEVALGDGVKRPVPSEREVANVARKSIVAARALPLGHTLGGDDVVMRRPGSGLGAELLPVVVGRTLKRALAEGELVSFEVLS
jgi:N,N'-diacetyllegionaminate synthase